MATLGGFLFIRNGIQYDYNFKETIESLLQFCDKVLVVDAGSDDGTKEVLWGMNDEKLTINFRLKEEWDSIQGREKLSYFQNLAADQLNTDYQFLCQADEVVCESSYPEIRAAIETGKEGYLCERINLWGSPNTMLNVSLNRMPCSVHVLRLSKKGYYSYDDGESIAAPADTSFVDKIKIIHYGFVRKKEVMKAKIINMQEGVFAMESHDAKLDQCEVFDSKLWFDGDDLAPIDFTHPPIMNQWILERM